MNENINGNITGVGIVSGGTVNQTINIDSSETEVTPQFLKDYYQHHFKTISLLSNIPKSIDDIFVNLAIIKEQKEETKDKHLNREAFLNSYEEIHKPKERIEIQELVNKSNKSLIYGKAGIGKTTLCKYIAYRWAKEEIYQEFEYLIYIPLREWKSDGIQGAIRDYYYSRDVKNISIDFDTNKTLFLFDGYDELNSDKKKLLRDEIEKYTLSHYIITTRPYGYQKSDFRVDEYFETIGFTDENVTEYIDNFFGKNSERAKGLKGYLQNNISIKHIGYIPLMLEMICSMWEQKNFDSDITMTELYAQSIENIFFEYTEKNGTAYIQDQEEEIFNYLGKIAFEGLKQQTIVLDKKIIKEKRSFFSDYVLKAGFLNDGKAEKSNPLLNSYQFPHLTFQEYFSALYVSKLESQEQSEIIRDWKFYPHMQMFFAFLGGLIEDKEFLLREIESEPRDVSEYYELCLLSNCLKEIKNYNNKIFLDKIHEKLIKWLLLYNFVDYEELHTKIYTNMLRIITYNEYFHTQKILDKLIFSLMNNLSHKLETAECLHIFTKYPFSYEENIKPFLSQSNIWDFKHIILHGNQNHTRSFNLKREYKRWEEDDLSSILPFIKDEIKNYKDFRKLLLYILNFPIPIPKSIYKDEYPRKYAMRGLTELVESNNDGIIDLKMNDNEIVNIALKHIVDIDLYRDLYDGDNLYMHSENLLMSLKRDDEEFIEMLLNEVNKNFNKFPEKKKFLRGIRNSIAQKLFKINNSTPIFIEKLISIIENDYVIFSNSIIVESVLKNAMTIEIFERLFNSEVHISNDYGYELISIIHPYDKIKYGKNIIFQKGIKISVLFQAYDKKYNIEDILLSNLVYSNSPLYLKNKKLHTIENGKEISTQREVDEATLNEIKMLLSPIENKGEAL